MAERREEQSRAQVMALEANVQAFDLPYFGMGDKRQGIVHIIGPEQGFTVPARRLTNCRTCAHSFHEELHALLKMFV